MTQPQVQVFGPLQVLSGGRAARIGAWRQRAILGRLVLAGGKTLGADRLIEDVWEGDPPPRAPSVLQVQIHNLRRVLEPARRPRSPARILVSEGSGYALRLDSGNVDAWRFEALLREYEERAHDPGARPTPLERYRMLDAALDCWHGEAFESFADASWAAAEVSRLTDLRATAIELRAQAALELDRPGEVVAVLRPQAEESPGREESARLLALAQYRLGRQVEALATLRRTRDYLRAEYGIDPGPRLAELESAILNQAVSTEELIERGELPVAGSKSGAERAENESMAPNSDVAQALSESMCYPRQRGAIRAAATEAGAGDLRLIWMVGEVGAGKTSVARAALGELAAAGWVVAYGRAAMVDGAPPAWAWTEVLGDLGGVSGHAGIEDPFTIVREVTGRCRDLIRRSPVAIVVEDMHRADPATLQVLRQLVTWLQHAPVLIIVTARGPEPAPALHATEAALADRMTARLELTGVDMAGTLEIARDAGLLTLDGNTLRMLHDRTRGNPLFVRELSKLMVAQGDATSLPESVRAVLGERIARLPREVRTVLQHMAVWGRAVDGDTLAVLAGMAEDELIDRVDIAIDAGLVRFDDRGRIELGHTLIRDTVYDATSLLRRTRMHWEAVELIEQRGADLESGGDPGLLAYHAARGASRATAERALAHVTAAAREGGRLGPCADVVELWRSVVLLHEFAGHTRPSADRGDRRDLLEALCELTRALAYDGQAVAARAVRERALDLAEHLGGDGPVLRALTCWDAPAIRGIRDWAGAGARMRAALDSALTRVTSDPMRARLLIAAVYESELDGDAVRMYERACCAVDLAHTTGDAELLCAALNAVAYTVTGPAGLDGWRQTAAEMVRVARGAGLADYEALGHYLHLRAACRDGDLRAAGRHAAAALECAANGRSRPLLDVLLSFAAALEVVRGDLAAAEAGYRLFDARMRHAGVANEDVALVIGAVTVGWARGDLSGAVEAIGALYDSNPELWAQLYTVALLHHGEAERARAIFERYTEVRRDFFWQTMAVFRARAAIALGAVRVGGELLAELRPFSGMLAGFGSGAVYLGPMDALLADLAELCDDPAAARSYRFAADALVRRLRGDVDSLGVLLDFREDLTAGEAGAVKIDCG
ncbi:AAA family ATPase [Nocardia sp. ET3-3]|uniref:AAA family ATPase n=1 Tax=Nocardia terrae TaxID=2675851 RepID=A0A7K1V3F9_9NOCA|nr:BTAD domain-containing putative transcriptional regulator [Nocardia terrae]MVU80979.1 AAA family ATPase [Nocardia terrae]